MLRHDAIQSSITHTQLHRYVAHQFVSYELEDRPTNEQKKTQKINELHKIDFIEVRTAVHGLVTLEWSLQKLTMEAELIHGKMKRNLTG